MTLMIEAVGLSRSYGTHDAVIDLSLAVQAGETFGLLGPNGAGKTTTLKLLVGMLRPSAGAARLGGVDVAIDPLGAKRLLGFVPDTPQLLEHLTGWEYLDLVADAHGVPDPAAHDRARELIDKLELIRVVTTEMGTYSLGQRKKIALAAALLHRPPVLILDEPTASLDPTSTRQVDEMLAAERDRGAAVLLSTHLLQAAQETCQRVGLMSGGRVIALGTPAEVIAKAAAVDPGATDLLAAYHVLMKPAGA